MARLSRSLRMRATPQDSLRTEPGTGRGPRTSTSVHGPAAGVSSKAFASVGPSRGGQMRKVVALLVAVISGAVLCHASS
jgi:hypothetical protein